MKQIIFVRECIIKIFLAPFLDVFLCGLTWKMPVKERKTVKEGDTYRNITKRSFYWTWLSLLDI